MNNTHEYQVNWFVYFVWTADKGGIWDPAGSKNDFLWDTEISDAWDTSPLIIVRFPILSAMRPK